MKYPTYWFSRSLSYHLQTNQRDSWYGSIIWFILFWPAYAFCLFFIVSGTGLIDGNHQITSAELYPGQFREEQEHLSFMKTEGRQTMLQFAAEQKQLQNNPDHQIH